MAGELKIDVRRKKILEILRRTTVRVSQLSDGSRDVVTIRNDMTRGEDVSGTHAGRRNQP